MQMQQSDRVQLHTTDSEQLLWSCSDQLTCQGFPHENHLFAFDTTLRKLIT